MNSKCPFCTNEDVGHFEIHHIDEDPSNNIKSNLLLLCPTCHSKITKGDITTEKVKKLKENLKFKNQKIQFISVSVDSKNCGWQSIVNVPNAFKVVGTKSLFPIFNFSFINQTKQTILLTNFAIRVKRLPVGLAGPLVGPPEVLRPVIKYKIKLPLTDKRENILLENEIEVPTSRAFKFQVELYADSMDIFNFPIL
ncbi:HNH endonuclease signature motif containing protein [Mesonia maritima]|uniref:HNH endonuclease signature motif containing protein n=1 Tax=Mesonia maritima TaxID=1793873 RepID=UPI00286D69FB|nr:HNH endonuclease signature motif containing protein [Mesonia maritima]